MGESTRLKEYLAIKEGLLAQAVGGEEEEEEKRSHSIIDDMQSVRSSKSKHPSRCSTSRSVT